MTPLSPDLIEIFFQAKICKILISKSLRCEGSPSRPQNIERQELARKIFRGKELPHACERVTGAALPHAPVDPSRMAAVCAFCMYGQG